jgi:hypothetical protein
MSRWRRVKNKLSTYSIAILIGLSTLTTVVVFHDPFASKVTWSVTTGSAPTHQSTTSLGQNQTAGTSLLTHGTTPQHSSYSEGGDDDGYGGTGASNYNSSQHDD